MKLLALPSILLLLLDHTTASVESNNPAAAALLDSDEQHQEKHQRRRLTLKPGVLGNDPSIIASTLPSWWNTVEANFKGENLKQCMGRDQHDPPETGHVCSVKKKTCYFGNQRCGNDDDDYPLHECQCSGSPDKRTHGTWSCRVVNCPACPVDMPSSDEQFANICNKDSKPSSSRLQCRYGTDKWYVRSIR